MLRPLLYVSAAVIVLSLLVTTLKLTTGRASAQCPRCHSKNTFVVQGSPESTAFQCRDCNNWFYGPPRDDFSWTDAIEEWLGN